MSFLSNLPYPAVIENLNYNDIKNEIKELFTDKIPDYELLESDAYSAIIEAIAYREMLLRARINDSILSMLIPYANGADLDNIVALYGVERIQGVKPTATVKFTLSAVLSVDVTVPLGAIFRSDKGDIARLIGGNSANGVTIEAGTSEAFGTLELDEYIKESSVKTEYIQNPLPFVIKAEQTTKYTNGADAESDEAFRERAILGLDRFSTAGSGRAYQYWALSSDGRVEEAAVASEHAAGEVIVYIKTLNNVDIADKVLEVLNGQDVRPLTDLVSVEMAEAKSLEVNATIELLDLSRQSEIDAKIKATKTRFALGEDVNLSYLYKTLHQEGVYRVTITTPIENQIAQASEFYEITSLNLQYEAAQW
ncbi:MAG: baseplate J/gp47 family protein [Campylobacteraceae bacterium]|jgi:phage-related baseplate assembly protein|nr:baseplate J/gp47 family protein [Campylobacteraceae bacterium]